VDEPVAIGDQIRSLFDSELNSIVPHLLLVIFDVFQSSENLLRDSGLSEAKHLVEPIVT
jgi:hypothetical protein